MMAYLALSGLGALLLGRRVRACLLLLYFQLWAVLREKLEVLLHFVLQELYLFIYLHASNTERLLIGGLEGRSHAIEHA
jgi:hypothetical protein